jgi:hypothetical protein
LDWLFHVGRRKAPEEIDEAEGSTKGSGGCLALDRAENLARQGTLTEARARELAGGVVQRTSGESLEYFTVEQWFNHWLEGKADSKAA